MEEGAVAVSQAAARQLLQLYVQYPPLTHLVGACTEGVAQRQPCAGAFGASGGHVRGHALVRREAPRRGAAHVQGAQAGPLGERLADLPTDGLAGP